MSHNAKRVGAVLRRCTVQRYVALEGGWGFGVMSNYKTNYVTLEWPPSSKCKIAFQASQAISTNVEI